MSQSTPVPDGYKRCTKRDHVKPLSEFARRADGANGGYTSACKECIAENSRNRYWADQEKLGRERPMTPEPVPVGHKRCSKGGHVKPISEFGHQADKRDGRRSSCKACTASESKDRYHGDPEVRAKHKVLRDKWRADNPTYFRDNYLQNRERRIADAIQYAKDNPPDPERVRRWARERYAANPEAHRAKNKAWRENNLERAREVGRRSQSRRRAQLRGLPFEDYTLDQILERDGSLCVLCGEELDLTAEHPDLLAATVEHLECISWPNSAGDVLANVAVAHFTCNSSRNNRPHPAAARKRAELLAAEQELII